MKSLMKILFFSLFSILLLGVVSAQTCTDNERIMRISAPTNAHGEIYNGAGNYATEICFSSLFPASPIPANPHSCTGTNRVLRLSADTNAHAQEPGFTGTAYTRDVCYGDLVCQGVAGNANCPANYVEVVSLSANNNAHIETAGANSYTGSGNTKICCQATNTPQLLDAKWLYYNGQEITSGLNVCFDNYVFARVRTSGLADGQIVGFLFSDYDSGLTNPNDPIAYLETTVQNNEARIPLNFSDPIIQGAIQQELPDGDSTPNSLELYFDAANANVPTIITSSQIIYQNDSNLCSFSRPQANIVAPVHRGIYYTNTEVTFTSGCTSQIGPVTNEWTITPQNGQSFTRTEETFNYTFTNPGQANVKLKCTDLDGKFDTNESQILIVASPYVLAYINEPSFNEITYTSPPGSGPYFPNEVSFSASDSFAVDSNGCTVTCLGGMCPYQTQNAPLSCGVPNITITQTTNSYNPFFFNWTFFDGDWTNEWVSFETGNGIYSGAVQYDDMSNTLNDKKARVSVTYTSTGANAEFEREFTLGRCLNNGNTYYSSISESYSTNEENSACKGGDATNNTADDCCAAGLQCLPDEADPNNPARYSCQIPEGGLILECNDFTNAAACNGNTNPSIPLASYGQTPGACTNLRCQWNPSTSTCGLNVTTYSSSSTTGACSSGPGAIVLSSCSYTTTVSECIAGRKTITYTTTGGPSCTRAPVTVPCGSLSFELSFFGLREFLLSILLIGAIYLVINLRKEINRYEK